MAPNKRLRVLNGNLDETSGGLDAGDLERRKGRIVSKKVSAASRKRYSKTLGRWTHEVMNARKELGLEGFHPIKKQSKLYKTAMKKYKASKIKKSGKKKSTKKG